MNENKFTPRAEEALRLSQEAAGELGHGYVGTEHLLLGLLREEEGIAHRVLREYGITDEMLCSILQQSVGKGLAGAAPTQGLTPAPSLWWNWQSVKPPAPVPAISAPSTC